MTQATVDELVAQGNELLRGEKYPQAMQLFDRARTILPTSDAAWKGYAHALYCQGLLVEAARAFDRAIGLRPTSATALWGGAIAHAELGNRVVAQNYLLRALELQPSWMEMVRTTAVLRPYFQLATRMQDMVRSVFGPYSQKRYQHESREVVLHVGRVPLVPDANSSTHITMGLCDQQWDGKASRVELVMHAPVDGADTEAFNKILANAAFHCADHQFAPEVGSVVRDIIRVLNLPNISEQLPHAYFASPQSWATQILDVGPPLVELRQLVPISEGEYAFWRDAGVAAFDALLTAKNIPFWNLHRPSAI